ncbi:MAG: dihydroneopterin aldolase [Chloroflexi bacterium]|nr:dihydroneopterin aldolase [Chloroflexota bacterium]MCH9039325.1 dihydroneopterin aldolase [Chloroflexota bacterium]MCI0791225.1 dihydroneopterin aldolase [Chloroflexota bacterium]MCI0868325.1 dihydroneopterin aldolase [Chloroflexota bacterium]
MQLKGLKFYGYHGVHDAEQQLGQRFVVDLEMELDLRPAGLSDDPNDTVNYSLVYQEIKRIMEGPPRKLLENVAESIASSVLAKFGVESVRVKVKKPEVPVKGSILDYASVEIYREKSSA